MASPTFPHGQRAGAKLDAVPWKGLEAVSDGDAGAGTLPVYLSLPEARIRAALAAITPALLPGGVPWDLRHQLRLAPSPAAGRGQEPTPAPCQSASVQVRGLLQGQAAPRGRGPISEGTGLFQLKFSSCDAQLGQGAEGFN